MTTPEPHAAGAMDDTGEMSMHAGAMLRQAREASGLTLDAVAQQLKLAPRQVKALEDADYTLLPGRTFVRGFARNYARLMGLDPQVIVDALPGASPDGGLESPPLHATAVKIGELPSYARRPPGWLRWALPVVIVAGIAAVVAYQHVRSDLAGPASPTATTPPTESAPAVPGAPDASASGATPLPSPVVSPPLATVPDAGPAGRPETLAAANPPNGSLPMTPASTAPASTAPASTAPVAGSESLGVVVRAPAWVEIKDAAGRTLVAQTVATGQRPSFSGTPPFELVIGNASAVTLTFRGAPVDLAPHVRGGVARLRLPVAP
ncbi:MAG: RodZ domain-containing protein [Casimicrobiaceae bacterium]